MVTRRTAVKGAVGAAALGVFVAGYWKTVERIIRPAAMLYGPDKVSGTGVRYVYSSCLGCNVRCGIRVRVASYDGHFTSYFSQPGHDIRSTITTIIINN